MQFIHITDLHYTINNPFQKALINSLLQDIQIELKTGAAPDFLVFSGDLVNNPDEPNIYDQFEEHFLSPLLNALGLPPSSAILCPGNHDVSHRSLTQWSDERARLATAINNGQPVLDAYISTGPAEAFARALSSGFFDLAARCGHEWKNPFSHHYSFPEKQASFIALNTGYACCLEGSSQDRGHLAISGTRALETFQLAPKDHTIVSLTHHSLSDLNESSSRILIPIINSQSSAHVFGHVHQPYPIIQSTPESACFLTQGGALYERDGQYNGYSFVTIASPEPHISARYRTYYIDRQQFDVGTNVAVNGTFYSSPSAKTYFETHAPPLSNDDVCLWLLESATSVTKELGKTITDRMLCDTFVEPPIHKRPHGDESQSRFSIHQILTSKSNIIISCPSEYGATSLLSYLTIQFHTECRTLQKALVPLFIDARRIRGTYEASVTSTLRSTLPENDDRRFKLKTLHDTERLVILIDDLDISNSQHTEFIASLRKFYPRARLIIAMKFDLIDTERVRPKLEIDDYELLLIGPLSRWKVRALVEKWHLPPVFQTDAVVDEIHSRFQSLGIPQTAAYIVIYLSVLESVEGYNPINSSTVIETFVESVLQKYKPQYAFRSSFDYRNQIHYLGHIAEQMCRKNQFLVEYQELYSWTKVYFDGIGVEHDLPKLIRHFIDNKIFADEGNHIYFRYNIFLSFFIAQQMLQYPPFLSWMLEDLRFINYINEFDIYCGLSRSDLSTLEFFGNEFKQQAAKLAELFQPLAWTDRLEKLSIPAAKKTDTEVLTKSIETQLTGGISAHDRDRAIAETTSDEKDVRPLRERPGRWGTIPRWFLTLRAYTVALKNLENISKQDKEQHIKNVLQGWSSVILYACIAFAKVIEEREIQLGNVHLILELPPKVDARLLRMIFLSIPIYISDLLRRDLGSQKLALQLKNDALVSTLSDSFLQTALYADLKLPEHINRLKAFKDKAAKQSSLIFEEILLLKMRSLFIRLGLQENEQSSFLTVAAEISAELRGLTGAERQREIDRYINEMKRKEQVSRLRELSQ
ncbi:metallophosphoesterase [Rhodopseudomonas palustris]|uniref:Metallophosphoesterase n=1 Tax=Rhodopseudomonas palustris TaxID=1076 RepID=A0AAX3E3D5_RHOPL|nr:metallophosphoesterase [Rhodopseudomonas palustris]UYO41489.1 metallophosphoesterase [Rhodopseudomonas palustris]